MSNERLLKKRLLLNLYTIDEILEVMGYHEGIGNTGWSDDVQLTLEGLVKRGYGHYTLEFVDIVLENSIDNGNFEEALKLGQKLPI